jgi:hypothetical protein
LLKLEAVATAGTAAEFHMVAAITRPAMAVPTLAARDPRTAAAVTEIIRPAISTAHISEILPAWDTVESRQEMTPIEASGIWKVWPSIKRALTYVFALGKRIATLEERVTHLEETLKTAPAESCPFCGARAQRLTHQSLPMGNPGKQWIEETWNCTECKRDYIDRKKI